VRIADFLRALYERRNRDYQALIRYDRYLNEVLCLLDLNSQSVDVFVAVVGKNLAEGDRVTFLSGELYKLPEERQIVVDALNLDLLNEAFSFGLSLMQLNSTIENLSRSYEDFASAFKNRAIDINDFKRNLEHLGEGYMTLKTFLQTNLDIAIELSAKARVLLQKKPLLIRFNKCLAPTKYGKKHRAKFKKEKVVFLRY